MIETDVSHFDVGQRSNATHGDNVRYHLCEISLAQEYTHRSRVFHHNVDQTVVIDITRRERHRIAPHTQDRTGIKAAVIILIEERYGGHFSVQNSNVLPAVRIEVSDLDA